MKDLITLASGKQIGVAEACDYLTEVGPVRQGLHRPGGGRLPVRGRAQAHRDRHDYGPGHQAVVFDEPEAGIDLWSFSNLIQVFEHLHEKINGSILIISHQERILNIADRIIVLADGQVQQDGARKDVLPGCWGRPAGCAGALSDKVR